MRSTLRMLLGATCDTAVVGEAGDGQEAVDLVAATAPHVVLGARDRAQLVIVAYRAGPARP